MKSKQKYLTLQWCWGLNDNDCLWWQSFKYMVPLSTFMTIQCSEATKQTVCTLQCTHHWRNVKLINCKLRRSHIQPDFYYLHLKLCYIDWLNLSFRNILFTHYDNSYWYHHTFCILVILNIIYAMLCTWILTINQVPDYVQIWKYKWCHIT